VSNYILYEIWLIKRYLEFHKNEGSEAFLINQWINNYSHRVREKWCLKHPEDIIYLNNN